MVDGSAVATVEWVEAKVEAMVEMTVEILALPLVEVTEEGSVETKVELSVEVLVDEWVSAMAVKLAVVRASTTVLVLGVSSDVPSVMRLVVSRDETLAQRPAFVLVPVMGAVKAELSARRSARVCFEKYSRIGTAGMHRYCHHRQTHTQRTCGCSKTKTAYPCSLSRSSQKLRRE